MKWTKEKPTKEGLYLNTHTLHFSAPIICKVYEMDDELYSADIDISGNLNNEYPVALNKGQWFGPIPEPMEKEE